MKTKQLPVSGASIPYADLIECAKNHRLTDRTNEDLAIALKETNATDQRFAILKELILRVSGLSLFDTQLSTAHSLLNGRIAELPTGEGKTLAAVVAAICYVLDGRHVHILVYNDYLAKRDWSENRSIYEICGLTAGFADQHSNNEQRKAAYACDVTYVSAKQAGFDFLRGFMARKPDEVIFPPFDVAIADEADSIMIDECITPLVLAGEMPHVHDIAKNADECIRMLTADDYELSHTEHQIWLTSSGIERAEEYFELNLYEEDNLPVLSSVQNALEAHYLLARDKDYIIKDGMVQLVEETTGRVILYKRYQEMLHRAVEYKEGIDPAPLTMNLNSITMQNFLRLYKTLCGMTGTAVTSANEFESTYDLFVDVIPPHTPSIRIDHEDAFFMEEADFFKGIIAQIRECNDKKQPVLVGTKSVADSEHLSLLLKNVHISHNVLNAKNDEEEAKLISQAGSPGQVTISTNMAGRGVDIRLGGVNGEFRNEAIAAGGLFIIGAGVSSSKRIDNQLRGRAGRQGDPGQSRFFVWLMDKELSDRMSPLERVKIEINDGGKRDKAIRRIQRMIEGDAADARYTLNKFSAIVEQQRVRLAELRNDILNGSRYFGFLENANPERYRQALREAGLTGIKRAEQQLALHCINDHWAQCLDTFDSVRRSIHFTAIGRDQKIFPGDGNVYSEYARIVVDLCGKMSDNIKRDIISKMETLQITGAGIDMEEAGLNSGTTTWTYAISENVFQFSVWRHVYNSFADGYSGDNGIMTKYYRKKRGRISGN
ncbi:MAG: accessory Sec system translocase SecA2 [Oscillospiraceae bacterium]|nr:accessory Sec system translocase SecA2 [Oscillospiraceae bacterium]